MKVRIDAVPGTPEWKAGFREARDAFVNRLRTLAASRDVTTFVACDDAGDQIAWVWNDADFRHSGREGTLEQALSFAAHMIDQGMRFAFGFQSEPRRIWLTTYERPNLLPCWPVGVELSEQETWDGVART